ncbi:MAG: hypothetical protein QM757_06585 [Paludibaculum sp.]
MLYTFVMDFGGGTYISQVTERDLPTALRAWAAGLDAPAAIDMQPSQKLELINAIESKLLAGIEPTSLQGLCNAWCTSYLVSGGVCQVNIVTTLRASDPSLAAKYSREAFLDECEVQPGARRLQAELAAEVLAILHDAIAPVMQSIVSSLNRSGHNLREYDPPEPGAIALRDDGEGDNGYWCDLRLAVDTVISCGFRDTRSADEIEAEWIDEDCR